MSIVPTKYGKMHIIDSDKVVSHALTLYGEWAMDELSLLSQIISPGMCVLDVGAFIGTHSLAFSKFVGHTGQVYSFEPRKEIYAVLLENLSLNGCDNVTALNMGLDKEKKIEGFTKKYSCNKLIYYERFSNIGAALFREKEIKKWRREKKENLIKTLNPHWNDLYNEMF